MNEKSFSIRIDDKTRHKLRVVSSYEGRSANSQILMLIRRAVEEFERQHGEIPYDPADRDA